LGLAGLMTPGQKIPMFGRISDLGSERLVPAIRQWRETTVERGTKLPHDRRQGIGEVLVLAPPKSVAGHDDSGAEIDIPGIAAPNVRTFIRRQEGREHCIPDRLQILRNHIPIHPRQAGLDLFARCANLRR
jgi:hypothetical protein